jgi:hypothetical protein
MDDTTKTNKAATSPRRPARQADPMVTPVAQARIGVALRELYESMKAEPLPDKLAALLQELERGKTPAPADADTTLPEASRPEASRPEVSR